MLKSINGLFPLFFAAEGGESSPAPAVEAAAPVVPVETAPANAPPVAAPVSIADGAIDLSKPETIKELTPEQRDAVLFGTKSAMPVEPASVVEPAAVAPPVVEPVVPPVEPEAESTAHPKNVRISGIEDPKAAAFAIAFSMALKNDPHANPIDVAREYGYELPNAALTEIPVEAPPVVPPHIAAARAEIEALDAELNAAVEGEVLMGPALRAKEKLLTEKKIALDRMEFKDELARERAQENQAGQVKNAREISKDKALAKYPTANDPKSLLGKAITRQFLEIKDNPSDPRYNEVWGKDTGPAWLTEQAVAEVTQDLKALGHSDDEIRLALQGKPIAEAKGPVTPDPTVIPSAKTAATTPVPRTVLVTSPGGKPAPVTPTLTTEQALEAARSDPKLREAALGFSSGRKL